jgi:hypothetical protein
MLHAELDELDQNLFPVPILLYMTSTRLLAAESARDLDLRTFGWLLHRHKLPRRIANE